LPTKVNERLAIGAGRNVKPIAQEAERILVILLPGKIFIGGERI
jgi:hypothetical protein